VTENCIKIEREFRHKLSVEPRAVHRRDLSARWFVRCDRWRCTDAGIGTAQSKIMASVASTAMTLYGGMAKSQSTPSGKTPTRLQLERL
jgi:hypothetical protein